MIDKSVVERAALRDLGISYVLCIFHMLQEVERYLKSGDSKVGGKDAKELRLSILHDLRKLQRISGRPAFNEQSAAFKENLRSNGYDVVAEYYEANWEHDAEFWAAWGRQDIAELASDTNNLIERFFGMLKYCFADGKVIKRLDDLIKMLLYTVVPHYINDRVSKLSGINRSRAVANDARFAWQVDRLAEGEDAMVVVDEGPGILIASSMDSNSSDTYRVCVGDLGFRKRLGGQKEISSGGAGAGYGVEYHEFCCIISYYTAVLNKILTVFYFALASF